MTRRLKDCMQRLCICGMIALLAAGTVCAKSSKSKSAAKSSAAKSISSKSSRAYSDADAADYELQTIKKMLPKEPVKALWRARILFDTYGTNPQAEALFSSCAKKVVSQYRKALEAKRYVDALSYYGSLRAVAYSQLNSLPMDETRLRAELAKTVPGLSSKDASTGGKVSSMIKGTVTVFVDKGIKVEHGVGYNDGVLGSGFFISRNGYIITNHHVISDCVDTSYKGFARLYVKLAEDSETRIPAKIIGYDKGVDLADAVIIMQALANPNKYGTSGTDEHHITEQGTINGDVYENGSGITSADALSIQRYLLHLIDTLPESYKK